MSLHLITVVGGNGWETLLPMLRYYESLGVDSFLVSVHMATEDDPVAGHVEDITRSFGCGIYAKVVGDQDLVQQEMHVAPRRQYPRDWFLLSDSDELQRYPMPLPDLIALCEDHDYEYVHGAFLDRVAADGRFPALDLNRPLEEQFPWGAALTQVVLDSDPRKITLVHGAIMVVRGQHHAPYSVSCPAEVCFPQVHHFKWRDSVLASLRKRIALLQQHQEAHVRGSLNFFRYIGEHDGRFDLSDPALLAAPCLPEYPHWEQVKAMAMAMDRGQAPLLGDCNQRR